MHTMTYNVGTTHIMAVVFMCTSSFSRSSWESVFSKSSEVVTAQELRCCQRVVQLCRDCLLVVYKFVADSRGSLSGLSPDWDDTRYSYPLQASMMMLLKEFIDTHITISTVNTELHF